MKVGRLDLHPHRTGLSRTADTLTLAGTVEPYNPSWQSVAVSREQILGMEGQLVAVSWPHDGRVDGFYRVDGVAVKSQNLIGPRALMEWQMGLTRVARGVVDFESTLIGATLTNVHGLTGGTPWIATPPGVDGLHSDPLATRVKRSSATGTPVRVWTGAAKHSVWSADASAYYGGAVTVRQNLAIVTGRFPVDPPGIFELSNDLCRVRWIVGEVLWENIDGTWDDAGDLTWDEMAGIAGVEVSTWNGSAWIGKEWEIGITPTRVAVTRNDPHVCTVRLIEEIPTGGRRIADLTMRRGASWVHVHHHGVTEARSVRRATAEAATAITGGVKASAATDSVTYVAATVNAKTDDLTQGGFTQASAASFTYMLGGAYEDTPEGLVDRWVSYGAEEVEPVQR